MIEIMPVTDYCQFEEGQTLLIEKKNGYKFIGRVSEIVNKHSNKEEVILCKSKNDYFITDMFLRGTSWVKNVSVVDAKITAITNTFTEFPR